MKTGEYNVNNSNKMKRNIILLSALAVALVSCGNKTPKQVMQEQAEEYFQESVSNIPDVELKKDSCYTQESESQTPQQVTPELTEERFKELAISIPNATLKKDSSFTLEYRKAWHDAWNIPDGGLGGIGMNEFMFYFVCDNDPCDSHQYKLDSVSIIGDTAFVDFEIVHMWDRGNTPHTFKLVVCNGQWVIADYDTTLSEMTKYLKEQKIYLKSEEYKGYANEILNDTAASEEWKERVRKELKEVDEFFSTIE